MASSDDESESIPHSVENYYFVDDKDEPISFAVLPIQWSEDESLDANEKLIFLHGTADNGLQKLYKQVTAWKFDLLDERPEISVLSKEKSWIKLQKPRKSFEDTIRTILITLHFLHFAKKNPETSGKSVWDHLRSLFSLYENRPSEIDLFGHMTLISSAVKRDEVLAKSKFLSSYLEDKPKKESVMDEDIRRSKFIVDDVDELDDGGDDSDEEETDLFDSVCAICDNGGELLCCEGRCLRSFHATVDAGSDSSCKSLGFSDAEVEAIQNFLCKNCLHNQHQCFYCGELGSSDKSSGAEVFRCVSATCGHFYHPECVAKLLHPGDESEAQELQKKIAAGETFTCPIHKCLVCKQRENKEVKELQFAICRRCPRVYHRKCLPRRIAFDDDSEDEDIVQRAWDDLIPNRILIYCLKHRIDEELGTPVRNHIRFPGERRQAERIEVRKRRVVSEDSSGERTAAKRRKLGEKVSPAVKDADSMKKNKNLFSGQGLDSLKKSKKDDSFQRTLKENIKSASVKVDKSSATDERKKALREERLNLLLKKFPEPAKSMQQDKTTKLVVDSETEKRILALMKESASSKTLDGVIKKHKVPSTHTHSSKYVIDKTITHGKVEGFVEAVRTALQKLEEGCGIEDAKAVCEPEILNQIIKWKNKLKVYLAPFIHGVRYTSFGRHFTKVDKLTEIVDKLHWYVQNGDMIVDFCCGSNDFSLLMKEKLEETGKNCSFKNFDIIQPKNDFNFEQKDWMTVRTEELPTGSQLIMGLNPPFGLKAALANKFIDKALEFKPKIIILIVPTETQRLDEKKSIQYDLIWEDEEKLAGKSFYLPGSVDIFDKQIEQWNTKPPCLYLWSRPDWSTRHKNIALKHGHLSTKLHTRENRDEPRVVSNNVMKDDRDYYADINNVLKDLAKETEEKKEPREKIAIVPEEPESLPKRDSSIDRSRHENHSDREQKNDRDIKKKQPREDPKVKHEKGKKAKGKVEKVPERKQDDGRLQGIETHKETSPKDFSPFNRPDVRSSLERLPSEALESPPTERAVSVEAPRRYPSALSGPASEFSSGYGGTRSGIPNEDLDDIERRYSLNREDSYTHKWSTTPTALGQEYGVRGFEEQFPGYKRDNVGTYGRTPFISELDEKYRRERDTDLRPQLPFYGRQDMDTTPYSSSNLLGQGHGFSNMGSLPSTTYGTLGAAGDSSYNRTSSSAMQRYAPRLDEMNHTRINPLGGPETPLMGRTDNYSLSGQRTSFNTNSLGFTAGPPRPYSHQNSGWLNE